LGATHLLNFFSERIRTRCTQKVGAYGCRRRFEQKNRSYKMKAQYQRNSNFEPACFTFALKCESHS